MRYRRLVVLGAVLACAWTSAAPAEDSAPATSQPVEEIQIPEPEETPAPQKNYFALDEFSAELGIEGFGQKRKVRTDARRPYYSAFDRRDVTRHLEETLGLQGSGYLIDERTLQFDSMVRLGLSQDHYHTTRPGPNQTTGPDGTLLEYDLRLRALPAGKISATAGASQLDDRLPRPFLPSLDRRRERYGVELSYNDEKLPMQLSYEHLYDKLSSGVRDLIDTEEQGEDTLRYEATWQPTDAHTLSLEYEYERRNDRYSGTPTTFDTTRNYFSLNDSIRFGPQQQSQFDGYFRIEDEEGDLARDVMELAPRLRLQHTDDLYSYYKTQYLKQSYGELETETHRGDIGLAHTWRDMLTSSGGFYGLQQNADHGYDMTEWGALANLSFRKSHTSGDFSTSLAYLHSESRTDDGRRGGVVIDEAATFRDPLPVYLSQRNVNRIGILVRDSERLNYFVEGLDYWVLQLGDVTTIGRNPLGRIRDRQTVLVSYTYRTFDDFKVNRDRVDFRVQDDFKNGFTPYYALSLQDEQVSSQRYLTFRDRNIHRHRVGFTFRKPRWSAGPEYEYNDDSIDPYQAGHLTGDVVVMQAAPHSLNADLRASYFDFRGEDFLRQHFTTLLDSGLTYRYALGDKLESGATARFRYENDSLFGETVGVDLRASMTYRIGEFALMVEAEYELLDLPSSTDNSAGVWFKVRRNIPIIGQRSRQ